MLLHRHVQLSHLYKGFKTLLHSHIFTTKTYDVGVSIDPYITDKQVPGIFHYCVKVDGNGVFTLHETNNDTENEIEKDQNGFHCNM